MKDFVWIEDRDWETGHGWRDQAYEIKLDSPDGDMVVLVDGDNTHKHPEYSYAWITPQEYWDKHGCLQDNIRTHHIKDLYSSFRGTDDMESHFEFRLSPKEMREHLNRLGFTEAKFK